MNIPSVGLPPIMDAATSQSLAEQLQASQGASTSGKTNGPGLRETFDQAFGETFYGLMVKAMRKTVDKPAYFHGGRGEEVFQGQFDQLIVERLAESTASQFTGPMFDLLQLQRGQ